MLNSKNFKMHRPAKKADYKIPCLFRIDEVISPMAVRLQLPDPWIVYRGLYIKL
jgi:hypothetical protein